MSPLRTAIPAANERDARKTMKASSTPPGPTLIRKSIQLTRGFSDFVADGSPLEDCAFGSLNIEDLTRLFPAVPRSTIRSARSSGTEPLKGSLAVVLRDCRATDILGLRKFSGDSSC